MLHEAAQVVCEEALLLYHAVWQRRQRLLADVRDEIAERKRVVPAADVPSTALTTAGFSSVPDMLALRVTAVATLYGTCELRRAEVIDLGDVDSVSHLSAQLRSQLESLLQLRDSLLEQASAEKVTDRAGTTRRSKLFVAWISLVDAEETCVLGQCTVVIDAENAELGPLWEGPVHVGIKGANISGPALLPGTEFCDEARGASLSPRPSPSPESTAPLPATTSSLSMSKEVSAARTTSPSHHVVVPNASLASASSSKNDPATRGTMGTEDRELELLAQSTSRVATSLSSSVTQLSSQLQQLSLMCNLMSSERKECDNLRRTVQQLGNSVSGLAQKLEALELREEQRRRADEEHRRKSVVERGTQWSRLDREDVEEAEGQQSSGRHVALTTSREVQTDEINLLRPSQLHDVTTPVGEATLPPSSAAGRASFATKTATWAPASTDRRRHTGSVTQIPRLVTVGRAAAHSPHSRTSPIAPPVVGSAFSSSIPVVDLPLPPSFVALDAEDRRSSPAPPKRTTIRNHSESLPPAGHSNPQDNATSPIRLAPARNVDDAHEEQLQQTGVGVRVGPNVRRWVDQQVERVVVAPTAAPDPPSALPEASSGTSHFWVPGQLGEGEVAESAGIAHRSFSEDHSANAGAGASHLHRSLVSDDRLHALEWGNWWLRDAPAPQAFKRRPVPTYR